MRQGDPGFQSDSCQVPAQYCLVNSGSISAKLGWWRGVAGRLTISGRRLDAPAPPLRAVVPEGYGELGFQPSGPVFPTEGCWEVTGKVGTSTLSFSLPTLTFPAT